MDTRVILVFVYSIVTEAERAKAAAAAASKRAGTYVEESTEPIGFFQAFMLPNVFNYAIAFGFFKLVSDIYLQIKLYLSGF